MLRSLSLSAALLAFPALAAPPTGRAALQDGAGKPVGTATFTQTADGVALSVQVAGLTPGKHGIHVHAEGKCEGPEFKSAGGHFNPTGKKHGLESAAGHHAGDLPNLEVGPDGRGTFTAVLGGVTLAPGAASLDKEGGTALVVHAGPDDLMTDPAGNSGARIACGVIQVGK